MRRGTWRSQYSSTHGLDEPAPIRSRYGTTRGKVERGSSCDLVDAALEAVDAEETQDAHQDRRGRRRVDRGAAR